MSNNKVLYTCKSVTLCKVTLEDGSYRYKVSDDQFECRLGVSPNRDFYSLRNALAYLMRLTGDDSIPIIQQ